MRQFVARKSQRRLERGGRNLATFVSHGDASGEFFLVVLYRAPDDVARRAGVVHVRDLAHGGDALRGGNLLVGEEVVPQSVDDGAGYLRQLGKAAIRGVVDEDADQLR